jgi:hypothetical protein
MPRMIGKSCPSGPGGRDCICCGDSPGKARTIARRSAKRVERNAWKREVSIV